VICEARAQPAAVAVLCRFRLVGFALRSCFFFFRFLPFEIAAGSGGLEDDAEGAAGRRGGGGGGLLVGRWEVRWLRGG